MGDSTGEKFGGTQWLYGVVAIVCSPIILVNWMYLLGFRFNKIHQIMFSPKFCHRFRNSIQIRPKELSRSSSDVDSGHMSESTAHAQVRDFSMDLPAPIGVRGFWSVVIYNFAVSCLWSICWIVFADAPCYVTFGVGLLGHMLSASSFLERTLRLYLQFCICQQASHFAGRNFVASEDRELTQSGTKFYQWALLNRGRILKDSPFALPKLIVYAFCVVSFSVIMSIFQRTLQDNVVAPMSSLQCQVGSLEVFRIVVIVIIVSSVLRLIFVRLMKYMEDSIGVKQELKVLGLNNLIAGTLCAIMVFWPNLEEAARLPYYWYFVYFIPTCGCVFLAHCYSIWNLFSQTRRFNAKLLSHFNSNFTHEINTSAHSAISPPSESGTGIHERKPSEGAQAKVGIEILLENPEACALFEEFLQKEFSIENLLCYKAILNLQEGIERKLMSDEGALNLCRRISQEFCGPNCRLPVNVSFKTMSKVAAISTTENISLEEAMTSLRKMKLEVLNLMKHDSFLRFKNDPGFRAAQKILHSKDEPLTSLL
jgi:hypothetical protein